MRNLLCILFLLPLLATAQPTAKFGAIRTTSLDLGGGAISNGSATVTLVGTGSGLTNLNAVAAISVMAGGAYGNGTNDDTLTISNIIQSALYTDSLLEPGQYFAHKIYFPAGTYRISSWIGITNVEGLELEGDSTYNTVLEWYGASTACAMFYIVNCHSAIIKNLRIWVPGINGNSTSSLLSGFDVFNNNTVVNEISGQADTWEHVNVDCPSGNYNYGIRYLAGTGNNNDYAVFRSCKMNNFLVDGWYINNQNTYNCIFENSQWFGWQDESGNVWGNYGIECPNGNYSLRNCYGYGTTNAGFYLGAANQGPVEIDMADLEGTAVLMNTDPYGPADPRNVAIVNSRFTSVAEGKELMGPYLLSYGLQGHLLFANNSINNLTQNGWQISLSTLSPFTHSYYAVGNQFWLCGRTNWAQLCPAGQFNFYDGNTYWYTNAAGVLTANMLPSGWYFPSLTLFGGVSNVGNINISQVQPTYAAASTNGGSTPGAYSWSYQLVGMAGGQPVPGANTATVTGAAEYLGGNTGNTNIIWVYQNEYQGGIEYYEVWRTGVPSAGTNQPGLIAYINCAFPSLTVKPLGFDAGQGPIIPGAPPSVNGTGGLTVAAGVAAGSVTTTSVTTTSVTATNSVSTNVLTASGMNTTNIAAFVVNGPVTVDSTCQFAAHWVRRCWHCVVNTSSTGAFNITNSFLFAGLGAGTNQNAFVNSSYVYNGNSLVESGQVINMGMTVTNGATFGLSGGAAVGTGACGKLAIGVLTCGATGWYLDLAATNSTPITIYFSGYEDDYY